ncbi:MAG: helix-turn-helix domain-containing protein [Clostridia bacterium]|nr:helix-turn-helix domain-containing protein [Clostridia bacterium]
MEYLTARQAASKWGVNLRTVHLYCAGGKIPGAFKQNNAWRIPSTAVRPPDRRLKKKTEAVPNTTPVEG